MSISTRGAMPRLGFRLGQSLDQPQPVLLPQLEQV